MVSFSYRATPPNVESRAAADSRREPRQRRLGALLGITQRTIHVIHNHSGGRLSPRKLVPSIQNCGRSFPLKRITANLSQPEVALKARVSERTVRAWEHDQSLPTEANGRFWRASWAWIRAHQKLNPNSRAMCGFTQLNWMSKVESPAAAISANRAPTSTTSSGIPSIQLVGQPSADF